MIGDNQIEWQKHGLQQFTSCTSTSMQPFKQGLVRVWTETKGQPDINKHNHQTISGHY
jgi:hypothetical protein